MSVSVSTSKGNTVDVSVGGGNTVSITQLSTSVSVSTPTVSSITVTEKGPKGDAGVKGADGAAGATGPQGPAGADGADGLTTEQVQDTVGAMFSGNTETRISATYDDADGTIDLVVDSIPVDLTVDGAGTIHSNNVPTLNQNTTGTAAGLSSTLGVASGGTGLTTFTENSLITGKGSLPLVSETNLTYSSETLAIGDDDTGIATIKRSQRETTGTGGKLNISAGVVKAGETDQNGGDLELEGGKGTGAGEGGAVKLSVYPAGASGSTINTTAASWKFNQDKTTNFASGQTVNSDSQFLKTIKVTLSTSDCNSLHTTPVQLVAAQGANKVIVPVSGCIRIDRALTQANSASDVNIHYAGNEPGTINEDVVAHFRRFMYNETGDRVYHLIPAMSYVEVSQNLTDDVNSALEISVDSAFTTNCFTSVTVFLTYDVIDIT